MWSCRHLTASDASLATTIFIYTIKAMLHLQFIKEIIHCQNGAVDSNHSNTRVLYHTNGLARVTFNSPLLPHKWRTHETYEHCNSIAVRTSEHTEYLVLDATDTTFRRMNGFHRRQIKSAGVMISMHPTSPLCIKCMRT